jgi:hypothetical protein
MASHPRLMQNHKRLHGNLKFVPFVPKTFLVYELSQNLRNTTIGFVMFLCPFICNFYVRLFVILCPFIRNFYVRLFVILENLPRNCETSLKSDNN